MSNAADKFWHEKIYNRVLNLREGVAHHPWSRRQTMTDAHAIAYAVTQLQEIANDLHLARLALLEQAQVAEAALQEAAAREAALTQALRDIRTMLLSNNVTDTEELRYVRDTVRLALLEKTTVAAAALLERLAELESTERKIKEWLAIANVDETLPLLEQMAEVALFRQHYCITEDTQQCADYIQGLQERLERAEAALQEAVVG